MFHTSTVFSLENAHAWNIEDILSKNMGVSEVINLGISGKFAKLYNTKTNQFYRLQALRHDCEKELNVLYEIFKYSS